MPPWKEVGPFGNCYGNHCRARDYESGTRRTFTSVRVATHHPRLYLATMSALRRTTAPNASTIEQHIAAVLAELSPLIRIEHTRIEIAEFSNVTGRLVLRMDGNCPDCELSPATFMPAIEAHLKL